MYNLDYTSAKEISNKWGISERRVRILCQEGKVFGAFKDGRAWKIPFEAEKPSDGRVIYTNKAHSSIAKKLKEVDKLKARVDSHRPLTQGELNRLREEFMLEYTYNSNAIEGNTLTLQETALVLEGITIDKKPLRDHLEAVGHRDAFLYVESLVKDKVSFSEYVIKQIHTLVLMDRAEDRGIYRRIPVRILGAYHTPTDPILVPEQMNELVCDFNNNKSHAIEKASLFHLRFEGIHPFIDGNGRTGRLIMNLMLMQAGYPPINVKFSDRKRYYEAFDSFYRDGDSFPMTEIILNEVVDRLRHLIEITGI